MTKENNIVPVFRAERFHGEVIDGIYFNSRDQGYIELKEGGAHPIKPETLSISIDNGESFYRMEQVADALRLYETEMEENESTNFPVNHEGL